MLFPLVQGIDSPFKGLMKSEYLKYFVSLIVVLLALAGCSTTSNVITGQARDPISPDMVKLYSNEPTEFEEIAVIEANSKGSMKFTEQTKTDAAIERLKMEAAKLGANGVLITGIADGYGGSISFGLGGGSFGRSSGASVGAGTSTASSYKIVTGVAIYVAESLEN